MAGRQDGPRRAQVQARRGASRAFRDYGLSITLFVLYGLAQVGSAIAGWIEFVDEASQHGQVATVFGDDGYIWTLLEQTLQNWQSEFLALTTLIVLSAVLLHRGSEQSRDGQDDLQRRLEEVQRRVEALADRRGAKQPAGGS